MLVDYHCETVKVLEMSISQESSNHHDSGVLKFMCYSECSR
nr:MAG TPA: DNA-binding domain protain [Caudoviricetes sp.]